MKKASILFLFFGYINAMEIDSSEQQNQEINNECQIIEQRIEERIQYMISFMESFIFAKFSIYLLNGTEKLIFKDYKNPTRNYILSLSDAQQKIEELSSDSCDEYSADACDTIKKLLEKLAFAQKRLRFFLNQGDLGVLKKENKKAGALKEKIAINILNHLKTILLVI